MTQCHQGVQQTRHVKGNCTRLSNSDKKYRHRRRQYATRMKQQTRHLKSNWTRMINCCTKQWHRRRQKKTRVKQQTGSIDRRSGQHATRRKKRMTKKRRRQGPILNLYNKELHGYVNWWRQTRRGENYDQTRRGENYDQYDNR